MKTKLLLITIALTVWLKVQLLPAQDVFPKSDAIWVIHLYESSDRSGVQYIYGLSGDTIVNSLTYQKLYLLNDSTLNIDHEDIYVAGIRQIDKQVWIQPADKKDGSKFEEFLMYDFGKDIGEEINFGKKPPMGYDGLGPTFEKVDLEWLNTNIVGIVEDIEYTEMGKLFYVSGVKWIEKIGSLSGLFFYPLQFPSGRGGPIGAQLICMKENDRIKYLQEDCSSCFNSLPTMSIIPKHSHNDISVVYISLEGVICIDINDKMETYTFNLVRVDGKTVLTKIISDKYASINIDNIPDGIYVYNIVGRNINQKGKLIVK